MNFDEKILDELWNGNIFVQEMLLNTDNKEINKISSHIDALHFELSEKLDANMLDKLNLYEREHGKHLELVSKEAFKLGFSIAVKIMIEAYQK